MWHYTTKLVLEKILKAGVLLPTFYLDGPHQPTLWFSSNPVWEPTAAKRVGIRQNEVTVMMQRRLTFVEQHQLLGHARIEAPPNLDLINYVAWSVAVGISFEVAMDLMLGGAELGGNVAEWYASFDSLPANRWASVEVWNGTCWEKTT